VQILSLYFLGTMVVFSMGLAAFFAALQVYFRDTASFLPYFIRIWMYLSPVLWLPESIGHMSKFITTIIEANPVYSMLGGYAELIQETKIPPLYMWLTAAGWAIGAAAIGFLFFISREREFAVRLT
jgi:ABC-type polysaccharide/polyol phosphate export permease